MKFLFYALAEVVAKKKGARSVDHVSKFSLNSENYSQGKPKRPIVALDTTKKTY